MVGQLGSVHITYAGIARAGLPAVKRSLDRYLARLAARGDALARQMTLPMCRSGAASA
jgi:hypothetical protein